MLGESLNDCVAVLEQGGQTIEIDAAQAVVDPGLAFARFRSSTATAEGEPQQTGRQGRR